MAQAYRLAGSQDPVNRIDRLVVGPPSEEFPDGKVLELGGDALELTDEEYAKAAGIARLEPVKKSEMHQTAVYGPDYGEEEETKTSRSSKSEAKG